MSTELRGLWILGVYGVPVRAASVEQWAAWFVSAGHRGVAETTVEDRKSVV